MKLTVTFIYHRITVVEEATDEYVAHFHRTTLGELAYGAFKGALAQVEGSSLQDTITGEYYVGTVDQLDAHLN